MIIIITITIIIIIIVLNPTRPASDENLFDDVQAPHYPILFITSRLAV